MYRLRWLAAAVAAIAAAAFMTGTAYAGSGGQLRIEKAWYNGHEITFLQPSLFSANRNGGVLACFGLGPDMSGISRPTQPLYVIFDDTATQDHCDGQPDVLQHDHILPVAPGDRGYTGAWTLDLLVEATPGSIDLATHPITTAAQVRAGLAAGTVGVVTLGLGLLQPEPLCCCPTRGYVASRYGWRLCQSAMMPIQISATSNPFPLRPVRSLGRGRA